MRVLLNGSGVGSVRRFRAVTLQAYDIRRLDQVGIVWSTVNVVATGARDAVRVHDAGHKIVALHAVLVRRAVGKVSERGLARFVLFEFPVILEIRADVKTDGPVVVFAFDRIAEGLALGMALDADVVWP